MIISRSTHSPAPIRFDLRPVRNAQRRQYLARTCHFQWGSSGKIQIGKRTWRRQLFQHPRCRPASEAHLQPASRRCLCLPLHKQQYRRQLEGQQQTKSLQRSNSCRAVGRSCSYCGKPVRRLNSQGGGQRGGNKEALHCTTGTNNGSRPAFQRERGRKANERKKERKKVSK